MRTRSRRMGALICLGAILGGPVASIDPEPLETEVCEPTASQLLEWFQELRDHSSALHERLPEKQRVAHVREIAFLLQERGLSTRAEQALAFVVGSSAAGHGRFADSLSLAELRAESGRSEDALAIAQRLSSEERAPEELLRMAALHADAEDPSGALRILEESLPDEFRERNVHAKLLVARCLWDCGAVERSLRAIDDLLDDADLPPGAADPLTLLRADCLFELGRFAEAREQYETAMQLDFAAERAAWIRLQLGNLAHREGEREAALQHYRQASESWPRTHYGLRAAWLLQTAERIELAHHEALGHGE